MLWRYEIKYVLSLDQWLQVQQLIAEHPSSFIRAYEDRVVNNIYFDTPEFTMCQDNIAGISQRKKVRLRWYGNTLDFNKIKLEYKIKNNALGRKEVTSIDYLQTTQELYEYVNQRFRLQGYIIPVLRNQYLRSYYVNYKGNIRLTVDNKITYQVPEYHGSDNDIPSMLDNRIIVEVKFDQDDLEEADEVTKFIHFRPSKHSKYVTGILGLWE